MLILVITFVATRKSYAPVTSLKHEITLSGNCSCNKAKAVRVVQLLYIQCDSVRPTVEIRPSDISKSQYASNCKSALLCLIP